MGIVSHDLRAPLSIISMTAHSLQKPDVPPQRTRSAALRVKRAAERMARMVAELLDFTRIAAGGGLPVERRPIDLRDPIKEAVDDINVSHPQRVHLVLPDHPVDGSWDADRIEQVVTNLVSNAFQYGAPDTAVQVQLRDEGEQAVVSVNNRGPIIRAADLPTLFDPFKKGHSGVRTGGLGLGLHIVYEVVKAHDGTIDVTSNAEDGTTFTARFPKQPSSER